MDTPENLAFPEKLRYRDILVAVFVVLLAFSLRSILVFQRAALDPSFYPEAGRDQFTYLKNASLAFTEDYPTNPHYFHPSPAYFYGGIFIITGTKSIFSLSLVLALLDALTCGFLIASGWLLTKKAWTGYLTGLVYAFYPVIIFYGTVPLTEPIAIFLLALFCWLLLWQDSRLTWWRTILLGLVSGAIALTRLNLVPALALYGLWLLFLPISWQKRILHSIVFAFFACLTIAPITWQNYRASGGDFIPVATTGSLELYMANNRDSAGRHGRSPAMDALDLSYSEAIIRDAQVAPEHFFGLLAYKFAMFWSNIESGNNYNFAKSRDLTFLNYIPLNFTLIASIGVLGFVSLWQSYRKAAIFLGLLLAWICFAYVLSFAFARIRLPAIIPLILLSGGFFLSLEKLFKERNFAELAKSYRLAVIVLILLISFSYWLLTPFPKLPPERQYSALPSDAIQLDIQFGDIILRGWRPLWAWSSPTDGYLLAREAYTVELFWQLAEVTEIEYRFYLAYIDEEMRYAGLDRPIGAVSFPEFTTDYWDTNIIIGEIVGIRLDEDVPDERSGQIRVGLWYWDEEGLIVSVPTNTGDNNILLQTLAVYQPHHAQVPDLPSLNIVFGEQIALLGYQIPETATLGETIQLQFDWQALRKVDGDYRLFLHLETETGEIIAQGDNRPIPQLFTQNWMPNYPLAGELSLTMPEVAGSYELYAGLYNEVGRLTIDAPDNRILLGSIIVE